MEGATKCELCGKAARIYCECDQATLCWGCDEGVHSANFLVEKHTRVLLCQGCGSRTPWKASGRRLGLSFSFCPTCSTSSRVIGFLKAKSNSPDNVACFPSPESRCQEDDSCSEMLGSDGESDTDSEYYDEIDEEEEEEGENQVVPWSNPASSSTVPPPVSSPSTSEREAFVGPLSGMKRPRFFEDADSEEEASSVNAMRRKAVSANPL